MHATAVALLLCYLVLSLATHSGVDANIGAGLAALGLLGLGVPWSIPGLYVDGSTWQFVIVSAGALLNFALHVGVHWQLRPRPGR